MSAGDAAAGVTPVLDWFIGYRVAGFGEFEVGPYSIDDAKLERFDIAGYEAVTETWLVGRTPAWRPSEQVRDSGTSVRALDLRLEHGDVTAEDIRAAGARGELLRESSISAAVREYNAELLKANPPAHVETFRVTEPRVDSYKGFNAAAWILYSHDEIVVQPRPWPERKQRKAKKRE